VYEGFTAKQVTIVGNLFWIVVGAVELAPVGSVMRLLSGQNSLLIIREISQAF
jgi:hypothetical protein